MDVSVVILTFNSENHIKICLDSIFEHTKDVVFEVVVVDNQSSDKTVEIVKEYGNRIKLIISPENGGYTKGNNLGIKASKGKYILIQNPDTQLLENSIQRLFLWMEAHGDVAAVAPEILNSEQKKSSISNAAYFPNLTRILAWAFFVDDLPFVYKAILSYHPHVSPKEEAYPDWVNGSFWMLRKEAIDRVGMLDEKMFMYGEELELCMRFKKAGFRIGWTPLTKVVHIERGSQEGMAKGAILGEFKGLKYIYGKYEPVWKQLILGSVLDFAAFLRVVFWMIRLKPQMVRIYLEALLL